MVLPAPVPAARKVRSAPHRFGRRAGGLLGSPRATEIVKQAAAQHEPAHLDVEPVGW